MNNRHLLMGLYGCQNFIPFFRPSKYGVYPLVCKISIEEICLGNEAFPEFKTLEKLFGVFIK